MNDEGLAPHNQQLIPSKSADKLLIDKLKKIRSSFLGKVEFWQKTTQHDSGSPPNTRSQDHTITQSQSDGVDTWAPHTHQVSRHLINVNVPW